MLFVLVLAPSVASGAVVAQQDFDGGAVGLVSSSVPLLDGSSGDFFGVGNRNAWPQGFPSPGVPFSLADDTVVGYSNDGTPFPTDTEGVFGQNSDFDNDYFALSDTREWTADQLVASWTFDITGFSRLTLSVDMGGISNASSGGYSLDTDVTFTVSIDAGADQVIFNLDAIDNPGFVTRPMDIGIASGGGRVLVVGGGGAVTKLLAEDGSVAANTYLDKTPPSGPGAGLMDTFRAGVTGTGSTLVLTMRASVPFEAMAFDNIVIQGDAVTPTRTQTWGGVKARYR
jgi:hypothetical protein